MSSYTRKEKCVNLFVRKTMGSSGVLLEVYVFQEPHMAVEKSNLAIIIITS